MSDRDHVVIVTPKFDDWSYVCTSCFHLLLYCPYTIVILMLYYSYYTCICYCYVWAPLLKGCYVGSQPSAHHINILRSYSDTHSTFIHQKCHQIGHSLLKSVVFRCIGIRIIHGVARELIQTYSQLIWVPMRLFQPYMPSYGVHRNQISCIDFNSHMFFIMGIRVQGISWDPNLGLMIRDLF